MPKPPRLPAHLAEIDPIEINQNGQKRMWDVDDPVLPDWIDDEAMTSGGYPYDKKLKRKVYEQQLEDLQAELVKVQRWQQDNDERVMVVFEGRDAAGKGGSIAALRQYMNPRTARNVALPKPTERERGQWYFQRYVHHFPTDGEFVTFDRSWYNRAGVEPVMGFCTPAQYEAFLDAVPKFEAMIVEEGIRFFKIWLNIGQEMQLKRFHARRHNRLKMWKFSPIDIAGLDKWADYTAKRDRMLKETHSNHAPWTVVRSNDKRRARIEVIRHVLQALPYEGKDATVIGKPDDKIIGRPPDILGIGT